MFGGGAFRSKFSGLRSPKSFLYFNHGWLSWFWVSFLSPLTMAGCHGFRYHLDQFLRASLHLQRHTSPLDKSNKKETDAEIAEVSYLQNSGNQGTSSYFCCRCRRRRTLPPTVQFMKPITQFFQTKELIQMMILMNLLQCNKSCDIMLSKFDRE